MKLGLVRHFKVDQKIDRTFLSPKEFNRVMKEYDTCSVLPNGLKINSADWDICYCSTLPRAITTAEIIYSGEIIKSELLVEVPISAFTKRNIKLPTSLWHIGARYAWYKSYKSQLENIEGTRERINKFYDVILNSGYERILIVAHGYFLHMFYQEMKKKGFTGDVDLNIRNGELFILEH